MPEKRLTAESRCWLCTFVLGRDYAWYATHIGCVIREYCTRVLISVIVHGAGQCAHGPDLYQWSFAEAKQTKTKRLKDFSRTPVSKMLESCQYLQGPWHLAATKRQTPCWHLSKMSGRSWIDRVSCTWMSAQDALSMSWIPWIHTTTGPLLQQRPWGHSSESCCCL